MKLFKTLCFSGVAVLAAGCISHEDTTYRDVGRVPVEFESEAAGRIFYEALSKVRSTHTTESKTDVSIPVVFESKHRQVTGPNAAFNDAVARCDTNQDRKITETEAKIFAQNPPK